MRYSQVLVLSGLLSGGIISSGHAQTFVESEAVYYGAPQVIYAASPQVIYSASPQVIASGVPTVIYSSACHVPHADDFYTEQVMISPVRYESRSVAAQYETGVRQELVTPERVDRHTEPAEYTSMVETKQVAPSRVIYRQAAVGAQVVQNDLIEGQVETVSYSPAAQGVAIQGVVPSGYVLESVIPAKTQSEVHKVLVKPARTYETVTPATYRSVSYRREVVPAHTETVEVPAVYETRQVRRSWGC